MNLSDIFCQDRAIGNLQQAFGCGRVGHAYIFAGADGVGRFAAAGAWAKLLLCKSPSSEDGFYDSCGECPSCRAFEAGSHPDFSHIYKELIQFTKKPENRTKIPVKLPIDVIREFVLEKVSARPSLSQSKVYIISEAEKLNPESQNALLKVLEEPPTFCFIILLCTRLDNLLPTTQSRCQTIRFGPVSEEKIIKKLAAENVSGIEAKYWSRFTGGSLGNSIVFSQISDDRNSLYNFKKIFIEKLTGFGLADAVDFAQWIGGSIKTVSDIWSKKERSNSSDIKRGCQKVFISMAVSALSDAMKTGIVRPADFINFDQPGQINAMAERMGTEKACELINTCYEAIRWTEAAVNEKLIFEHLLLNFVSSGAIVNC